MWMRWWWVAMLLGCTSQPDLRVDLRTDYVGGIDFETVEVALDDGSFETVQPDHRSDYLAGVRLITYDGLDMGTHRLVVRLVLGPTSVAERAATVSLRDSSGVAVVITRSCWGIECDPGQACLGFECVDEACNPETPSTCNPQCASDAECGAALDCQTGRCLDGVCLFGDAGRCGEGLCCHPDFGCMNAGSTRCPPFMEEVGDFCIDVFESGDMTWVQADAYCEARGGFACGDNE